MKRNGFLLGFLSFSALLGMISTASAITIDNFSLNPADGVRCDGIPPVTKTKAVSNAGSIGGTVSMYCHKTVGVSNRAIEVTVGNGYASGAEGPGVNGDWMIEWDGDANSSQFTPTGLGLIDLTQDGGSKLKIEDIFFDCPGGSTAQASLKVTVYDGQDATGDTAADIIFSPTCPNPNGTFFLPILEIPFSSFVNRIPSSPVDFRKIGGIRVAVSGISPEKDFEFGKVATDGYCPLVPGVNGRVVDDCGVCAGINQDKDACGVCFGNNQAKDDCGICFGNNQSKDACGVCGGDGKSCLGCVETIQTATISALDDKSDEFIQNALFFLERVKKADPKYFKSARVKIKNIKINLEKQIIKLPPTTLNCVSTQCVKSSVNANVLIEIEKLIEELYKISKTTLSKPVTKAGGKCKGTQAECKKRQQTQAKQARTLSTLAKRLYNDAKKLKDSYPKETTVCPDGLLN